MGKTTAPKTTVQQALKKGGQLKAIPVADIFSWIGQYGFELVLEVFQLEMSGDFSQLNVSEIVVWVTQALAAMAADQPPPPLPTPGG